MEVPGDLTERQIEVILYQSWFSRKETAEILGISIHTVGNTTDAAFKKLGANNMLEALNECVSRGYFSWEEVTGGLK